MAIINEAKVKNPLIVGIRECFGVELDLPGTIAKGDPTCQLRYVRKERRERNRCHHY